MTTKPVHHPIVSLKLPKSVSALITYSTGMVTSMTGNPSFPTPVPALAAVTTAIDELHVAEAAALARTHGAVAVRNEKRAALVSLLVQLKAYIQMIADGNVDNAPAIIQSAGVSVRKSATPHPRTFDAKPGTISGTVRIRAKSAARRASYDWEYSLDGGKTMVALPSTLQAKTTVTGLAPGSTVEFRFRSVTKTGQGDWSQPLSFLVQ